MLNINRQIVNMYEVDGCTPEEIAEELDWEVEAVKTALMQSSTSYRKAVKKDTALYTEEEVQKVARALYHIALDDSIENVGARVRAGQFVVNEAKGRNDVRKELGNTQVNIMVIQDRLQNMKRVIEGNLKALPKLVEA